MSLNFETTTAPMRQQATQIMAQNLAGCGIEVTLGYHPASEWFASGPDGRLAGRLFDLGQFAWLTGVDPACNLYLGNQMATEENGWLGRTTVASLMRNSMLSATLASIPAR